MSDDPFTEFMATYHKKDVAALAVSDHNYIEVDYSDLYSFDPDLAADALSNYTQVVEKLAHAALNVDTTVSTAISDVSVRITGLGEEHTYTPGEIRKDQGGKYVAVSGVLDRVTSTSDLPKRVAFKCQRCGVNTVVLEQSITNDGLQEPHECADCERNGVWEPKLDHPETEWHDYAKLRLNSRPDASDSEEGTISGYVLDELIDVGGESGIFGRAGEPITVYGVVRRVQKRGRQENNLLFDHLLEVKAIEFERDSETVEIETHRAEFEALATEPDAVDLWAESIAPQLHTTDAWDAAFEFAVAYLFGAPRIDIPQGPTYRGDLHFMIITDFGMGKSTFKEDIAAYSPKCISKSTTALSSGVGLTAAAVQDDFGEGQWTLKPGLLVRANGGHLILDEIDKGPDELTEMNDALEGEQVVDVEKAGESATYESRTGVLALGNPVDGRFGDHGSTAAEMGIDDTLLSRFDGIVTMRDKANVETDEKVAETYGRSYTEAQEKQYGDREEFDTLDREVPVDVGEAWIKYARENVNPILHYEQFEELKTWYAEEVRQLNHTHGEEGTEGGDMPVPATVRVLGAAVKMAIAFARVHLRDEVAERDVKRAKKLGKRLVKQNWDGEKFDASRNVNSKSQQERRDAVVSALSEGPLTISEVAEEVRESYDVVRNDLKKDPRVNQLPNNRFEQA